MRQIENELLSVFSDQSIFDSSNNINHFLSCNQNDEYDFESLVSTVNPLLLTEFEKMLQKQVEINITQLSTDEYIEEITDNIFKDISQWYKSLKNVLNVVLCKRILENKNIFDGNKRIDEKHLKRLLKEEYTEDLLYINLVSERDILRYNSQKE